MIMYYICINYFILKLLAMRTLLWPIHFLWEILQLKNFLFYNGVKTRITITTTPMTKRSKGSIISVGVKP